MNSRTTPPGLDPGTTLAATTAIREGQHTFTREQAAYLVALAYHTGRLHAAAEDLAEVAACWAEYAQPRPTREQRIAARMAEMDQAARQAAARAGRPYRIHPGGPVDWETGRPATHNRNRHLTLAAGGSR